MSNSGSPGTVTVTIKVKYLWLVIGLLLVLLATSPVYTMYLPAASSSNSGGGGGGGGSGGGSGSSVNCANPCDIYIKNSVFGYNVSQTLTIKAGTTVTWMNIDDTEHTTTSNSGVWGSPILAPGKTFSFTFSTPGTYPYHCEIHPMTATIIVVS
ncbi:MAG: cupredoxin domain-containing protein [Nitrososphaerota archaeon]|nr:cupredoxin domain-containing protein [Nitrososphaerota archaeon]